jgi:hypothetical protein
MKLFSPWTVIIVFSGVIAGIFSQISTVPQARVAVVLWFLLVCPGLMVVRFFRLSEPVLECVLAVTLSLVIDTFVAGILLYAGLWSPGGAFAIILAITIGGALAREVLVWRARRSAMGTIGTTGETQAPTLG